MFEIQNLTKSYGRHRIIDDLTFAVPDGAVTGFLGPNGSGKSTTMRCMLGLDRIDRGDALIDGRPLTGYRAPAHIVGAMLDAGWLNPKLTARGHLRSVARSAAIDGDRVEKCLALVGLESVGGKRIGGFSLGMKQRLGLATVMLGDPAHLVLDEPVNGLDPDGIRWIRRSIRAFADEGRAVLVSSHLLSEMEVTADRLVIIGKGRLIGEWDKQELLRGHSSLEEAYWSVASAHAEYGSGDGLDTAVA
ncbi:ATP-binding cassette domain-containing protein [Corynebacterium sp. NPDC060344]|uniref:ATP-binding cassette domain-containing protein n=1 Tax=Corynebacterium sp. NPDC060344 TaxID=3347101 RepID=UPI00364CB7D8